MVVGVLEVRVSVDTKLEKDFELELLIFYCMLTSFSCALYLSRDIEVQ